MPRASPTCAAWPSRRHPATTVRRIEAIMTCRERLAASVAPLLAVEELALTLAERPSVLR